MLSILQSTSQIDDRHEIFTECAVLCENEFYYFLAQSEEKGKSCLTNFFLIIGFKSHFHRNCAPMIFQKKIQIKFTFYYNKKVYQILKTKS